MGSTPINALYLLKFNLLFKEVHLHYILSATYRQIQNKPPKSNDVNIMGVVVFPSLVNCTNRH